MKENTIIYKLSSGEEVIGKLENSDEKYIMLKSPLRVERITSQEAIFYTLRAWFCQQFESREETTIAIFADHIIAAIPPGDNMVKQYNSTVEYLLSPSEDFLDIDSVDSMDDSDDPDNIVWPTFPGRGRPN